MAKTQDFEAMLADPNYLAFNGINGATGDYGIPLMTEEQFAKSLTRFEVEKPVENFGVMPGIDSSDLSQAGWAIIFSADDPNVAAIEEALSPLLKLRQGQAGELFRVFKGENGYRSGERARSFLNRQGVDTGAVDPAKGVPYYLLLVGSPEQIAYREQFQLDVQFSVGRIYFDTLQEYANYAASVVAAETGQVKLPRKMALFGVENEGDKATQMSHQYLIEPLYNNLKGEFTDWEFDLYAKEQATKSNLTNLLGGAQTPALLFSASHGMEFPLGDSRQLPHQGALLCQNWPGPRGWRGKPIPQDFYFAGDDLTSNANLSGLISFNFACYGGGCPRLDEFSKQSGKSQQPIAPYSFLAQLPTKMLSRPHGGALAVIAHVERAWGYSFYSKAGANINMFKGSVKSMLFGDPIGYAVELINERFAEIATLVTSEIQDIDYLQERAKETGNDQGLQDYLAKNSKTLTGLWTEHNDARDYIIIGDPAVRLPVAAKGESAQARPIITMKTVEGKITTTTTTTTTSTTATMSTSAPSFATPETATKPQADASFGLLGDLLGSDKKETPAPVSAESTSLLQTMKGIVEKLGQKLAEAVDDLTSLEVLTYTSNDLGQAEYDYDTKKLKGDVTLRAMTRMSVDGDILNLVPKGGTSNSGIHLDQDLWQAHREMVQLAQTNRIESIKALSEIASTIVKAVKE